MECFIHLKVGSTAVQLRDYMTRRISKYFKVEIFPTATTIYIYDILHSSLFVCVSSLFLQASLGNSAMLNTTATESLSQCPLLLSQFNAA